MSKYLNSMQNAKASDCSSRTTVLIVAIVAIVLIVFVCVFFFFVPFFAAATASYICWFFFFSHLSTMFLSIQTKLVKYNKQQKTSIKRSNKQNNQAYATKHATKQKIRQPQHITITLQTSQTVSFPIRTHFTLFRNPFFFTSKKLLLYIYIHIYIYICLNMSLTLQTLRAVSTAAVRALTRRPRHAICVSKCVSLSLSTPCRSMSSSAAASSGVLRPARLQDKVAIITGGASGIGRESSVMFAQEGASIVVTDVNESAGAETVDMIRDAGGKAVFLRVDVSKEAECKAMVDLAEKEFGKLDILFNNAGIMHSNDGNASETTPDIWDLTMDINVKGVWFGCKYGIEAMQRNGSGSIINTASFVGKMGAATTQLAYTTSKGAVLAMSRELAVVHARQGIRINALCPGPLRTELLMKFLDTDAKKHRRLVHLPMGRFGEAREMAQAALFLASDEASYITGTDFLVDGGLCSAYVTPEEE
jgi:NAD(P)-dependent dehydrogenase (short-subunit alcohol dehydrogenase family)